MLSGAPNAAWSRGAPLFGLIRIVPSCLLPADARGMGIVPRGSLGRRFARNGYSGLAPHAASRRQLGTTRIRPKSGRSVATAATSHLGRAPDPSEAQAPASRL